MIRLSFFALAISLGASGIAPAQSLDNAASRLERAARVEAWPQAIRDSQVAPRWLKHRERLVFWDAIGPMAGTWVMVDAGRRKRRPVITPASLREQLTALTGRDVVLPAQMPFVLTPDERGLLFDYADTGFRVDFAEPIVRRVERGRFDAQLLAGGTASSDGDRIVS